MNRFVIHVDLFHALLVVIILVISVDFIVVLAIFVCFFTFVLLVVLLVVIDFFLILVFLVVLLVVLLAVLLVVFVVPVVERSQCQRTSHNNKQLRHRKSDSKELSNRPLPASQFQFATSYDHRES